MPLHPEDPASALRLAMDHVPQGVAVFDAGLRLVTSNGRYNGLLALPADLTRPGTALFDIAGASATLTSANLDRHWRNIRTISTHNPTSHKAFALGNLSANQVRLPTQGFF